MRNRVSWHLIVTTILPSDIGLLEAPINSQRFIEQSTLKNVPHAVAWETFPSYAAVIGSFLASISKRNRTHWSSVQVQEASASNLPGIAGKVALTGGASAFRALSKLKGALAGWHYFPPN